MSYFMNFIRYPNPGQTSAVLEAVKQSVKAVGRPGNVAVPVSVTNPTTDRPSIVSLIGGFQSLDELDALQEASLNDNVMMQRLDSIDALCERATWVVSEIISDPISSLPDGYEPKIISRTILNSKPGKREELVNALLEGRANSSDKVKPVISVPLAGPAGRIRVSRFAENLRSIQEGQHLIGKSNVGNISDLLTQSPIRIVSRIVHSQ